MARHEGSLGQAIEYRWRWGALTPAWLDKGELPWRRGVHSPRVEHLDHWLNGVGLRVHRYFPEPQ